MLALAARHRGAAGAGQVYGSPTLGCRGPLYLRQLDSNKKVCVLSQRCMLSGIDILSSRPVSGLLSGGSSGGRVRCSHCYGAAWTLPGAPWCISPTPPLGGGVWWLVEQIQGGWPRRVDRVTDGGSVMRKSGGPNLGHRRWLLQQSSPRLRQRRDSQSTARSGKPWQQRRPGPFQRCRIHF